MKKQSNQQNPKNTNEQQLFLEMRNGNFRSSRKLSTLRLRKVTATRQVRVDHSLAVKATKPKVIKRAAKFTEELSQPNENSDAKQDGIQHTRARLGESVHA